MKTVDQVKHTARMLIGEMRIRAVQPGFSLEASA